MSIWRAFFSCFFTQLLATRSLIIYFQTPLAVIKVFLIKFYLPQSPVKCRRVTTGTVRTKGYQEEKMRFPRVMLKNRVSYKIVNLLKCHIWILSSKAMWCHLFKANCWTGNPLTLALIPRFQCTEQWEEKVATQTFLTFWKCISVSISHFAALIPETHPIGYGLCL